MMRINTESRRKGVKNPATSSVARAGRESMLARAHPARHQTQMEISLVD